tara:strand:+ start:345 stop:836 length:492 start_codon:yes stop_codon:yes gene_type:complete
MSNCSRCSSKVPKARIDMGYTICINCSTEEKKMGHVIYPHKTGGYVQVVDSQTYQDLNRIDRRGYKGKGPRQYKNFVVKQKPMEERKSSNGGVSRIKHLSYDNAFSEVMNYYEDWGYDRTIKYLRELSSSGKIPLRFRVTLQNKVVDRCMKPTPRALIRKYSE